ncbi:MAG: hypothetical protein HOE80_03130 [Candidatus Magasanikbacteria bacterium]|jgi:hypothetical protein|nr:hypothetical protein [Candidatus Magasanikbacteria bacterium]MBT4071691.1 hypothetical protein [Candidatus Magasanikbacteria bacterium]
MLDLRQRLFIGIGIIVGIIVAIILVVILSSKNPPEETPLDLTVPEPAIDLNQVQITPEVTNTVPVLTEDMGERYLRQFSRLFVERFSSVSNQNNNRNIDDVLALATPKMVGWLETQRQEMSSTYEGVSTQVISSELITMTDMTATVVVGTQQIVQTEDGEQIRQKDGRVELEKINREWKISGFYWDKGE